MKLIIDVEIQENLKNNFESIKTNIREDLNLATKTIGSNVFKKAEELASQHLPQKLANMYKSSLKIEQLSENTVVIELDEKVMWLDAGRKSGFMDELLKSGTKTSKDGFKYRIIPIGKNKENSKNSLPSKGENLINELKNFLVKKNIRIGSEGKIELDKSGSPRIGRIHSFNIKDIKDKKQFSDNITRVNVFQNKNPKTGKIEQNVTAFKIISEKHRSSGKWVHPGIPPTRILEKILKYSEQLWITEIFPAIKRKYEE